MFSGLGNSKEPKPGAFLLKQSLALLPSLRPAWQLADTSGWGGEYVGVGLVGGFGSCGTRQLCLLAFGQARK